MASTKIHNGLYHWKRRRRRRKRKKRRAAVGEKGAV
jgi:hypothetical protein